MLSYFVSFIHEFVPVALVAGLLVALWAPARGGRALRPAGTSLVLGILAGLACYPAAVRLEGVTATRCVLYGVAIATACVSLATLWLARNPARHAAPFGWWGTLCFLASLGASATFAFLGQAYEKALSATSVLNTELILNLGGILLGLFVAGALIPLAAHLGAKCGRRATAALLLVAVHFLLVPWSGEVLLGLMRLELVELTSSRLTFVAKVAQYSRLFPYLHVGLILALALLFLARRRAVPPAAGMAEAERRKVAGRAQAERRWFKVALTLAAVVLAMQVYDDAYASRPPKLSPATYLEADGSGLIRIRIADVADGILHRYAYVTDDGHVVRFILINRSVGQTRIGVVYDACMLCGDMGYIQQKNEVICVACNVRIFTPSIGKAGGCNPIPLEHAEAGGFVEINAGELDNGARYFSQVISKKVKDPVSGRALESGKAASRYEFKGRTYFFESEATLSRFRETPETFVGQQTPRYTRVQGFRQP